MYFYEQELCLSELVSFTLEYREEPGLSLTDKLIEHINHLSDDVRMM